MTYVIVIILAGIFGAIGQYLDKHLVNLGISKHDYFYYMCLSMIPFSIIMIIIEYFMGQLKFSFSIIPILLLIIGMFIRYNRQHTIVGCLKYLNPYEDSAYLTLGIVIAFIIDVFLGIQQLKIFYVISIILTIVGVFAIANAKIKIVELRKDLFIKIFSSLLMSYVTHFMLLYWSNAAFLFVMNLFLTLIFSKNYKLKYHMEKIKIIKFVFLQQFFGFSSLYLSNFLVSNSVTLSSYVEPMSIVIVVLISMFFKDKKKRPNFKQLIGLVLILCGIFLLYSNK